MWTTREVARFSPIAEKDEIVSIEIVKEFNQESLDGILEWSHCWLITISPASQLEMHAFEIRDRIGRKLLLFPIQNFPPNDSIIIDIKPIHSCDIS
jgi:hypothetical protein